MELLAILLGEFLLFPVIAAFGTFINLIFSVFFTILEFIVSFLNSRSSFKPKEKTQTTLAPSKKPISFKWVAKLSGTIFLVAVLVLVTINTALLTPTMNWVFTKIEHKTNIEVSFESVHGNIFIGALEFQGLRAIRQSDVKSDIDVKTRHIALNVNILSLITKPIVIEKLALKDVEGTWLSKDQSSVSEGEGDQQKPNKIKPKTEFVIEDLSIQNINFVLNKADKPPLTLTLDHIESAPFRSKYAIFDTFFRSNIEGSINSHKITVASREEGEGRVTKWHLDHFPVEIINQYVQKAPISWFKSGVIDVRVEDQWEYGENARIDMDWNLKFKDVVVQAPQDASLVKKALAAPIVKYLNNKQDADIGFGLIMNENEFESTASLDAAGLWSAAIDSLSKKLALATGEKKEAIKEGFQNKVDGFKNFLNKKRE